MLNLPFSSSTKHPINTMAKWNPRSCTAVKGLETRPPVHATQRGLTFWSTSIRILAVIYIMILLIVTLLSYAFDPIPGGINWLGTKSHRPLAISITSALLEGGDCGWGRVTT